jgi:hypothetical protein
MNSFLNRYETVTYDKLRAVADKVGAHVFSKVRLADVIPVNKSGISNEEFSYALKAHVDFLVTDANQIPQFCVEFDGPSHQDPVQVRRDEIKNMLFDKFDMPYVRVNGRYLDDKYRGLDLLTYFVDVWFLCIAFDEAQAAGNIPGDEIFDPSSIISDGQPNGRTWPYWLSLDLQIRIQKMYEVRTIVQPAPSHGLERIRRARYGASRGFISPMTHVCSSKPECVGIDFLRFITQNYFRNWQFTTFMTPFA